MMFVFSEFRNCVILLTKFTNTKVNDLRTKVCRQIGRIILKVDWADPANRLNYLYACLGRFLLRECTPTGGFVHLWFP